MADTSTKISQMPAAVTANASDVLTGLQGGLNKKFPLSVLAQLFSGSVLRGSIAVSDEWTGSASPYTQIVTVTGAAVTAASKVDLQLTAGQVASLAAAEVKSLLVENDEGVLTLYAVGNAPTSSFTVQCTVTETIGG